MYTYQVHNFVLRHLYAPAVRAGYSNLTAQLFAFTFSAVLHEILISVPTRMFSTYSFFGMFGQIPLIILTRWLSKTMHRPVYGNLLFWVSFLVLGQPLIILLYSFDYFTLHGAIKSWTYTHFTVHYNHCIFKFPIAFTNYHVLQQLLVYSIYASQ